MWAGTQAAVSCHNVSDLLQLSNINSIWFIVLTESKGQGAGTGCVLGVGAAASVGRTRGAEGGSDGRPGLESPSLQLLPSHVWTRRSKS